MNEFTYEKMIKAKEKMESADLTSLRSVGEFFGIRVVIDPNMRPDDWKIVCGVESYRKISGYSIKRNDDHDQSNDTK